MTDALARWLAAKNYRGIAVNIVMLTAVRVLAGSVPLLKVVGGGAILIASICFLFRAASLTFVSRTSANFFQIALIWVPGVLASCLALTGLYLVTGTEPLSLGYTLGVILFGCELVMLSIAAADLNDLTSAPVDPVETI